MDAHREGQSVAPTALEPAGRKAVLTLKTLLACWGLLQRLVVPPWSRSGACMTACLPAHQHEPAHLYNGKQVLLVWPRVCSNASALALRNRD
jgi:hypothetical protein